MADQIAVPMTLEEVERDRRYAEQIIAHMDEGGTTGNRNVYDLARMVLRHTIYGPTPTDAVIEQVCQGTCPPTFKTDEPRPHSVACMAVRAYQSQHASALSIVRAVANLGDGPWGTVTDLERLQSEAREFLKGCGR